MSYRIWYSTESFADYIIAHTALRDRVCVKKRMYESDANNARNFHTMPDHIKKILYLDAPDLIVEKDTEPLFSVEVSTEAGTGHNAFQRFARLAASVENNVPAFYIYPEAAIITRQGAAPKWDRLNPLIFKALEDVMSIYRIPALLYYFPSDHRSHPEAATSPNSRRKGLRFDANRDFAGSPDSTDTEMQAMFQAINETIQAVEQHGVIDGRNRLLGKRVLLDRRSLMQQEYAAKGGTLDMSPLTATIRVPTSYLLNALSAYEGGGYAVGELLRSRPETIIYKVDAAFRGDPYPGARAAIDYLLCREGRSFEERRYNLVMAWGNVVVDEALETVSVASTKASIQDFVSAVQASEGKNLLTKDHSSIPDHEIPRYYMQVRYGSMFSKVKHIRVYAYFADAILFTDGALWRDA
ncbi:MAG: hypothetical protein LPK14_07760 [Hymenobacteraceae bacterium]|nr:hypothetical protein [Hymenobacteraceae bacterium]